MNVCEVRLDKLRLEFGNYRHVLVPFLPTVLAKGQLISKGLFKVFICTKKRMKMLFVFLPLPLKRGQIKKIRALYATNRRILF